MEERASNLEDTLQEEQRKRAAFEDEVDNLWAERVASVAKVERLRSERSALTAKVDQLNSQRNIFESRASELTSLTTGLKAFVEGDFGGDGRFVASEPGLSWRLDARGAGSSVKKAAKGSRLELGSRCARRRQ
ncbi:hypothetical protein GUJ93_ZPchr0010g8701 [Zizania palustris]|uniref:Uncharacterized protein n=1 Tax=Zizania palustris TaxID=103762 RepID=A0A8J5SZ50_ZIZPA|nr:hypothetical protein GUJ93_ZPchr0010g8701 [Zizania palustris]